MAIGNNAEQKIIIRVVVQGILTPNTSGRLLVRDKPMTNYFNRLIPNLMQVAGGFDLLTGPRTLSLLVVESLL